MAKPYWSESLARLIETKQVYAVDSQPIDRTSRHSQPGIELNLTCAGRGTLLVGRKRYSLAMGTLVIIPSSVTHELATETPGRYIRSVVCVSIPKSIKRPMASALQKLARIAVFRHPLCLQLTGKDARDIRARIASIASEGNSARFWNTEMLYAQTMELLILVSRLARERQPTQSASIHLTESIASHIASNLDGDLTTKTMALRFGISREYLSRIFHRHYGITYQQYVMRQRLTLARRLLRESPNTSQLLQIALEAGFQSHANFCRAFRKHEGITPTEFRDMALN